MKTVMPFEVSLSLTNLKVSTHPENKDRNGKIRQEFNFNETALDLETWC